MTVGDAHSIYAFWSREIDICNDNPMCEGVSLHQEDKVNAACSEICGKNLTPIALLFMAPPQFLIFVLADNSA